MTYDKSKVKDVICISCHKPIGDAEYEEIKVFARFGQLLFRHKSCLLDIKAVYECMKIGGLI